MKEFFNKANIFFEKGLDSAKKGCKMASKKISEIEEETKNRLSIVEKEKEVDKLFKELGKKVYKSYINKEKADTKEICKEIDQILEEKTNLENNVLKLKDLVVCENCHNTIDVTCTFCPYCGYIQESKEEEIIVEEEPKKETKVKKETKTKKEVKKEPKAKEPKKEKPKVATIKLENKTKAEKTPAKKTTTKKAGKTKEEK